MKLEKKRMMGWLITNIIWDDQPIRPSSSGSAKSHPVGEKVGRNRVITDKLLVTGIIEGIPKNEELLAIAGSNWINQNCDAEKQEEMIRLQISHFNLYHVFVYSPLKSLSLHFYLRRFEFVVLPSPPFTQFFTQYYYYYYY